MKNDVFYAFKTNLLSRDVKQIFKSLTNACFSHSILYRAQKMLQIDILVCHICFCGSQ